MSALPLFGTQRVLRASGTRLAPTEPEARPQVQILSHRFLGRGAGNIGLTVFPVLFLFLRQDLNADKHSPASSARSTKRRVRGECLCQWELKAPTDRSRSDCVHEQVAKRIANVRFTVVRDAEGAACQWHAFSTDRAGGETASSNLVASIPWQGRRKHWINSVSGSFFVFETGFERR